MENKEAVLIEAAIYFGSVYGFELNEEVALNHLCKYDDDVQQMWRRISEFVERGEAEEILNEVKSYYYNCEDALERIRTNKNGYVSNTISFGGQEGIEKLFLDYCLFRYYQLFYRQAIQAAKDLCRTLNKTYPKV